MFRRLLGRDLGLQFCRKPRLLFAGEPFGLLRSIGQIEPGDDAEQDGGDALDDE
jgi:hypothetical protein